MAVCGMLTCPGTPVSSSIIINTISYCEAHPSHGYAYYFFDGRDSQKELQAHKNLILSLITQLSHQCNGLRAVLSELYNSCSSGQQEPSIGALQNTLQTIVGGYSQVYIIIDSLDECVAKNRGKLLDWLEKFSR